MSYLFGGYGFSRYSRPGYRSRFEESSSDDDDDDKMKGVVSTGPSSSSRERPQLPTRKSPMNERARYIPLRLTHEERRRLRIIESSLSVSEYTDHVEVLMRQEKKQQVIKEQLRDILSVICGLFVASDYKEGKKLMSVKEFSENAEFFQNTFEIARRFKVTNPEKMRSEYGKLVYLLQDASMDQMQEILGFNVVIKMKNVFEFLEQHAALALLEEPDIELATQEILYDGSKTREELEEMSAKKDAALKSYMAKYVTEQFTKDDLQYAIFSLTDNNSFLNSNARPIHKMIALLKKYFKPDQYEDDYSLAIQAGRDGARLSHSHSHQYTYVIQSLELWAEFMENMFMLWSLAERDLLDGDEGYRLMNTGQGLNRMQHSPQCYRAAVTIVSSVQQRMGSWMGSSVVHMGDHNVPNALMFIDKYTQVPRILVPIVRAIESVDDLMVKYNAKEFIESTWGDAERCKKTILSDFFRHGFDGSGADNFMDAGSCIDGRLTSAWNWCSKIEKKKYYPVFLLSGFVGFDGDFQK